MALVTAACTSSPVPGAADGSWVGTITTEGHVTAVINESGSVWGGTATLVEELSIGVDEGDKPYMLGWVSSVFATQEEIYVADMQVPAVRVYGHDGRYLRDIGGPGQGPGEYGEVNAVSVLPDGRIIVRDYGLPQRLQVYSPQGRFLETLHGEASFSTSVQPVVTYDGEYFTPTYGITEDERQERIQGMGRVGRDGVEPPVLRAPRLEVPKSRGSLRVGNAGFVIPLVPGVRWAMLPSKTMVAAVTTEYRLIADRSDGTRLVIERPIAPVPIDDREWEWRRRALIASARRIDPGFLWDGDEMPHERGHISSIFGDRSKRIWVRRVVQVNRVPGCTDDPLEQVDELVVDCYENVYGVDVFDEATGKLLGEGAFPDGLSLSHLFVVGDELYATTQDDAGTIMVKRFRLVLPSER